MRINQIFADGDDSGIRLLLRSISSDCSEFITEASGLPLFKALPVTYEDFRKVKVRKAKRSSKFSKTFNEAFDDEMKNLRERSVFANGQKPEPDTDKDVFYVFPKNGYRYMYCTEVQHSTADYKQVFDSIFENADQPEQIIHDLLKFSYVRENLNEGIDSNAEIIFYNIPYYYSVRTTLYESYNNLLTDITEIEDN